MKTFRSFYQVITIVIFLVFFSCQSSPPTADLEATASSAEEGSESGYQIIEINPRSLPRAVIKATPTAGYAPLKVKLDGSEGGGLIKDYKWQIFDEPGIMTVEKFEHTFHTPGVYVVSLTVTDEQNRSANDMVKIRVLDNKNKTAKYGYLLP